MTNPFGHSSRAARNSPSNANSPHPASSGYRFAIEAYGVPVDVEVIHGCEDGECLNPDLREKVHDLLPPGWSQRRDDMVADAEFRVRCNGPDLALLGSDTLGAERTYGAPEALHLLDGAIRSVIAQQAKDLIFVHAGVVALNGHALVLPGRSMAGKTTLVAALVRAGALYLSDEYAVISASGLIHPYPRRLSVRGTVRQEVPVESLGGTAADKPMPVGLVAAITYEPNSEWLVQEQGPSSCALALIANAIAARARSEEVLKAATIVADQAHFVAGTRGELDVAVPALLNLLTGSWPGLPAC